MLWFLPVAEQDNYQESTYPDIFHRVIASLLDVNISVGNGNRKTALQHFRDQKLLHLHLLPQV